MTGNRQTVGSLASTSGGLPDLSWQAARHYACNHFTLLQAILASNPVGEAVAFPSRLVVQADGLQALLTVPYAIPCDLMKGPQQTQSEQNQNPARTGQ